MMEFTARQSEGTKLILFLKGDFTEQDKTLFQTLTEVIENDKASTHVELDCTELWFIDSSAIGMLLLIKDKMEEIGKQIRLIHVKGMVKDVLELTHMTTVLEVA